MCQYMSILFDFWHILTYTDTYKYIHMARFHKSPKQKKDVKILKIITDNDWEIQNFLRENIENSYYHWNKFQRIQKPKKYSHEELWQALKFIRSQNNFKFTLQDEVFYFRVPNFLLEQLHYIDLHLGWSIIMDDLVPKWEEERYLRTSLIEEAIASSQIEWAATTRKRAKEMFEKNESPKNLGEQMIFNNYLAMQYISRGKESEITREKILELHAILTKNTLKNGGDEWSWRHDNEIVVVDSVTGEILHTPIDFQKITDYMDELVNFFNTKDTIFIHPIIKGVIIHFLIGWIHPFVDGNGRTARALFYWYILKNGYWLTEYIAISRSIKENTEQYKYAYLATETDDNDLTYFINYNIQCLRRSLDSYKKYIQKKMNEEKHLQTKIQNAELTIRQWEYLHFFEEHKQRDYTLFELTKEFEFSRNTIKKDIDTLVEKWMLEVLARDTKTRSYRYV